jgi:hypothetical protein
MGVMQDKKLCGRRLAYGGAILEPEETAMNRCGECKRRIMSNSGFWCTKWAALIPISQDTSDCKDFERKDK